MLTGREGAPRFVLLNFNPRTIGVINYRHMGDVLCSFPALLALRTQWPDAKIVVLAPPLGCDLLTGSGLSDVTVPVSRDRRGLVAGVRALRRERADLVICLQNSRRLRVMARCAGARHRIGFAGGKHDNFLTQTVEKKGPPWLFDDLRLVEALGCAPVQSDIAGLLKLSDDERARAAQWRQEQGVAENERLIGVNLGASDERRVWPLEHFARVVNALQEQGGARVVLLGGPTDIARIESLQPLLSRRALQCAGEFSPRATAALLERCAVLVTNDSGPMHLSIAVETPVVGLFGPVAASHRLPPDYGHIGLEHNAPCRAVRQFGCVEERTCAQCPCLLAITPDEVIAAALSRL